MAQKKPDGIKAEWDFSGVEENSSSSNVNAVTPTVVQKGKFTITKRTSSSDGSIISQNDQSQKTASNPITPVVKNQENKVSNSDNQALIINNLKARISSLKNKINSIKNENMELKSKIDNLNDEVQKLNV